MTTGAVMSHTPTAQGATHPVTPTNARSGERVMEWWLTNIYPDCTSFRHYGSNLPCGPTRAQIATGLFGGPASADYGNHGVSDDENNPIANYVATYQVGQTTARGRQGPWELDKASALPPTHVAYADQGLGLGYDAQAFTGWLGVWLARSSIPVAIYGKWQNGYRTTNAYAFPGVVDCCIVESETAHNTSVASEFTGTNAWDGTGQPTTATTYSYAKVPSSITRASNVTTVTASAHNLEIGDTVTISLNMTNTSFDGTFTVTAKATNTFSYANAGTNQTISSGFAAAGSKAYCLHEMRLLTRRAVDFIESQTAGSSFFLYMAPRANHVDSDGTYTKAAPVEYLGTVPTSDAFYWQGTATGVSPVGPTTSLASYRTQWAGRQAQLAAYDDMIRDVVAALENGWHGNYTLIFTSDNGDQIGEQDGRGSGATKNSIWEGSMRAPLFIYGPGWTGGEVTDCGPTSHSDIAPTVLKMFATPANGLAEHHAIAHGPSPDDNKDNRRGNRDGYPIQWLMEADDPVRLAGRALPIYGPQGTGGSANGYIQDDFTKRTRNNQNRDWFPYSTDAALFYEKGFVTRSAPDDVVMQARADLIQAARFDTTLDANPAHTV